MIYSSPATWGKLQIMTFLKEFFSGHESGNFKYNCEPADTEVSIISQKEVVYEDIGSTPVISVDDSGINSENKVMNFLSDIDFTTNARTYLDMYAQTIVISCSSTLPAESKRISDIVFNGFKYNVEYIMEKGFQKVLPVSIGDSQTISGSSHPDVVSTPVIITVEYTVKWVSTPSNPVLLNSVDIKIV